MAEYLNCCLLGVLDVAWEVTKPHPGEAAIVFNWIVVYCL